MPGETGSFTGFESTESALCRPASEKENETSSPLLTDALVALRVV